MAYAVRVSDTLAEQLDLPTVALLAGDAAADDVLRRLRADGHAGVRRSHGYVIQVLLERSPTIGELALDLGVSQQAASKAVGELEDLGYVERRPCPDDRRVRRVGLTAGGHEVIEHARRRRRELEDAVRTRVGDDGVEQARRALVALVDVVAVRGRIAGRRVVPPLE